MEGLRVNDAGPEPGNWQTLQVVGFAPHPSPKTPNQKSLISSFNFFHGRMATSLSVTKPSLHDTYVDHLTDELSGSDLHSKS
jgi:hypothetical protein